MTYTITIQSLRPARTGLARFKRRYDVATAEEARDAAINDLRRDGWDEGADYHIVSTAKRSSYSFGGKLCIGAAFIIFGFTILTAILSLIDGLAKFYPH